MYCEACGARLQEDQNFCRACGKPVAGAPVAPAPSRLGAHLRLLGLLWLAISGFRMFPAALMAVSGRLWIPFIPVEVASFVKPIILCLVFWMGLSALCGFVTGWGLLERHPWARTAALVLGCLALLDPPMGTA